MTKKLVVFTAMHDSPCFKKGDKFTIQGVYEMTRWGAAKRRALNTWRRFYWPVKDLPPQPLERSAWENR